MIFHHVLRSDSSFIAEKDGQFLLYVGGEGGTGKSRIIDAVRLGMGLLQRRDELLVMAPTGNAAKNIRGSTMHTSLDIAVHRRKHQTSTRVSSLWTNKSIIMIDEISIVSSKLLNSIDKQCNRLKNLDANSTAVFGGLPVVILLGDFHQFPPIRAKALWQKQEHEDETRGRQLWETFTNVVCLDEQMRQQDDVPYYDLLTRARNGTLTQVDVNLLNTRVVTELEMRSDRTNTCIVRANKLRHVVNRSQIERFARFQDQRIFIFPGTHKRWKNVERSHNIDLDKIFQIQDGSEVKGPGFLLYTHDMPTMVLSNISTPLGIVNGAQGKAIGIIPDPNTEICDLDDKYTLCSHPPLCVLFNPIDGINTTFPGLEPNVFPIFGSNSSVSIQNMSISRYQIPITPAWAITDYKIQGSTCEAVTLDLHLQRNCSNRASSHKRYCSIYVQLSRVRSLQGLSLLQPITIDDVNCKPDSLLRVEDERIALLEKQTDITWRVIESTFSEFLP